MSPQFRKLGRYAVAEYAILRVKKLKSEIAILGSLRHTFREQLTPNADPDLLASNTLTGATSTVSGMHQFRSRLPKKVRKNAVLALEYLITASPEAMAAKDRETQDYYFRDALEWLREKHGDDNVFCTAVHRDETTPHLVAYVIPKDEHGKLNCRKYLGERGALRALQTDFADRVGKYHHLRRGVEGSKAKHQTISSFYGLIQNDQPETASKTFLGNIRPEYHHKIKNALEAYQARDKAIKHRERILDQKIHEAEAAIEAKNRAESALLTVERELSEYKSRFEKLLTDYNEMDRARMNAIDEARHYRDLMSDKKADLGL